MAVQYFKNFAAWRDPTLSEQFVPSDTKLNEGLLQPPDKSKMTKGIVSLLLDGKQPFSFVSGALANEIATSIENLLGVKNIKGLSEVIKEKATDIAKSYMETIQYPQNDNASGDVPAAPAATEAPEPTADAISPDDQAAGAAT